MPPPSLKAQGWAYFDKIVASADLRGVNPWSVEGERLVYGPDFDTLERLLTVPLRLNALSQSGVPALALDVWSAYELRRAGFHPDRVWPRASAPRVLPYDVTALLESLPRPLRTQIQDRLGRGQSGGTATSAANLLGKNYVKQVDVVIAAWQTGPELMISTKRMDSSFGKNAANRVEESYGDAKNLSLRHPEAALGFLYSLRSTAFVEEPEIATWLTDLLGKLGREQDAYDAVCLVVPEWNASDPAQDANEVTEEPAPIDLEPIDLVGDEPEAAETDPPAVEVGPDFAQVRLRHDLVPPELSPARFFAVMVETVLMNSPINFHRDARRLMAEARDVLQGS